MSRPLRLLASVAVAAVLFGGTPARAVDYAWIGSDDGPWTGSGNWDPVGVPSGTGDKATVNNGATAHTIVLGANTTIGRLSVGYVTDGNDGTGSVVLGGSHALTIGQAGTAGLLHVGGSLDASSVGKATGSLHLASGTTLSLVGGTFHLGSRAVNVTSDSDHTTGTFTMEEGATLNVGTAAARGSAWEIGVQRVHSGSKVSKGTFEATGGVLTAYVHTLNVAANMRGGSHASGNKGEGLLDLTGLQSALIDTRRLYIGNTNTGNATGAVKLGSGTIMSVGTDTLAGELLIGHGGPTAWDNPATGANVVEATLSMGPGSSLTVGTPQQAATMVIGRSNTNHGTTVTRTGELLATGGTFAGHLSSLVVGEQLYPVADGKTFTAKGTLDLRQATITDFQVTGDVTIGYSAAAGRIAPDVSSLPGTLQLWLDAADVNNDGGLGNPAHGTTITQWSDKSGNDLVASMPSGYSGPTYHAAGTQLYNDKPILYFGGSADDPHNRLRVTSFVTNKLQDTRFTAFIVMDGVNGVANGITGAIPRLYLQGHLFAYDVLSPTVNWTNPAGYNIHTYQHDGTNISAWLDSVLMGSLERDLAATTGHLEIPFKSASVERFAEIIIFTHDSDADVFTDAQRLAVERYLQNKYTGVWQNSQGYVYLSQVEGSIGGSLKVGDTAAGSEGLLELHGTHLDVAGSVNIYDTSNLRVFVPDVAAGLSLLETSSLGIGTGASYDILFEENPAAGHALGTAEDYDAIHYGLKWSGDHVDALLAAALAGKLTWDDTTNLTGPFRGVAGIFFDAGTDATYVGFYVIPEPSTLVLLLAALTALAAVRRRKRPSF